MDFIADQNALVGALKAATTVAERNPGHGLSALLLTGFGETVTVASTDLNMALTQSVDAYVGTPGKMALNAKLVWGVVSKFGKGDVSFGDTGDGRVEVKQGAATFYLPALVAWSLPTEKGEPIASLVLPASDLAQLIKGTIFSTSPDCARVNLAGIFLTSPQKGTLRLVSTDGHRLSYIDCAVEGAESLSSGIIIPRKAMQETLNLLQGQKGEVRLDIDSVRATLSIGRCVISANLVQAEYPDYNGVIPKTLMYETEVDARAFASAVRRLAPVTNRVNRGIELSFEQGHLCIRAADEATGEEIVEATGDAPNITVRFDSSYLVEVLAVIGAGRVKLKLNHNLTPMVVLSTTKPNLFHLMMPQRPSGREKETDPSVSPRPPAPKTKTTNPDEIQAKPTNTWHKRLLEWTGGERNRPLALYRAQDHCRISASDADGSGFSVCVEWDDAERLNLALRLPHSRAREVFEDGDDIWHVAHYGPTIVSSGHVEVPELLRFLLRAKSRFACLPAMQL